jgi:hypothetical protein
VLKALLILCTDVILPSIRAVSRKRGLHPRFGGEGRAKPLEAWRRRVRSCVCTCRTSGPRWLVATRSNLATCLRGPLAALAHSAPPPPQTSLPGADIQEKSRAPSTVNRLLQRRWQRETTDATDQLGGDVPAYRLGRQRCQSPARSPAGREGCKGGDICCSLVIWDELLGTCLASQHLMLVIGIPLLDASVASHSRKAARTGSRGSTFRPQESRLGQAARAIRRRTDKRHQRASDTPHGVGVGIGYNGHDNRLAATPVRGR